MEIERDELLRI